MRRYSKCMGSPLRAGNWALSRSRSRFETYSVVMMVVFSSGLGIFAGLILTDTAQFGCWTKLHKSLGHFPVNNDKRVSMGLLISHTQSTVLIT